MKTARHATAPVFAAAHASHPDASMALGLALAQLDAQAPAAPTLGWCYLAEAHAGQAEAVLAALARQWPGVAWVGATGRGVCAGGVEYFDEPAVVLMLCDLPRAHFRVFSGRQPLPPAAVFPAHVAQVHADPATPELDELLRELSQRMGSGYLFGGLASAAGRALSFADGVCAGGLSGVAFDAEIALVSRVSQGCQPVGRTHRIDEAERQIVYRLDGEPALDVLLRELGLDENRPREMLGRLRQTLVALGEGGAATARRGGMFGPDERVRHLIGLDPARRAIAVAESVEPGQTLSFCRRDAEAARRDLLRIGAEIRSTLEPEELPLDGSPALGGRRMLAALYASCTGRGGPHFGAPSAELELLRHALGGDAAAEALPLAGFFAAGEIGHHHLYGYTGVLTVFTAPA